MVWSFWEDKYVKPPSILKDFSVMGVATIPSLSVWLMSNPKGAKTVLRQYLARMVETLRRNWIEEYPVWTTKGQVILEFSVDRSGKVLEVAIISTSGTSDFDSSLTDVVRASGPFAPLPESFQSDQIVLHVKLGAR